MKGFERTTGHLIDVHPDGQGNMVTWIKTADGVRAVREPFVPVFYVHAPAADLRRLERRVATMDRRVTTRFEHHRLGLDHDRSEVLCIAVAPPLELREVAACIDQWGQHRAYDLYDVDLRETHRYFIARGLYPFAHVAVGGGAEDAPTFDLLDDQWDLDPVLPTLTALTLEAEVDHPMGVPPGPQHPLKALVLDGERHEGHEEGLLETLQRHLIDHDPDLLLSRDGDRFLMKYLRARAAETRFPLQLGRAPDPGAPLRGGRSYFSYGQVKWQAPVEALYGRIHLDIASSFFHKESGLAGMVDLARISSCPIQELSRLGPGTAVTAVQIDRAKREGRLVPWKKNEPERMKSERALVEADRGGYIHDPKVGLYDQVIELDFSSMYPSIMVTRNVSPETILCGCCSPDDPGVRFVPQTGYPTCRKSGFVGRSIGPLLQRREAMKRRMREDPDNRARWQGAVDAMKWLLVCSFGYQGYRNARFGRIECHEAICAWGREILLTATEIARDHGFDVLHGIVDSLWLQRDGTPFADMEGLEEAGARFGAVASKELGIRLDIEGTFDWIVFLPNRSDTASGVDPIGALNRFYGKFSKPPGKSSRSNAGQAPDHLANGQIKVRGVEMRQRSAPQVVRETQERMLLAFAPASDATGFLERIPDALDAVRPIVRRLRDGTYPFADLWIKKSVQKERAHYRANTEVKAALDLLAEHGVDVAPGDSVRYIVKDAAARDPHLRVVEKRVWDGEEGYDPEAYLKLVYRAVESLLLPFGWTYERVVDHYSEAPQARLDRYGVGMLPGRSGRGPFWCPAAGRDPAIPGAPTTQRRQSINQSIQDGRSMRPWVDLRSAIVTILLLATVLAGCLTNDDVDPRAGEEETFDYEVPARIPDIGIIETQHLIATRDSGVELHVRLVRPDVEGPVPVITEFTPYQALGPRNPMLEPIVGEPTGAFVSQFVQRGFAFAYADVRGTGDSGGCMDLRGSVDIQDAWELTEWLGTQDWSNGKVGFIGASYPGSTSHIAAIANNPHLGGVVPIVASTSFYAYHHKDGVPYSNHLTTNNAYNAIAIAPTVNPHTENYVMRYLQQPGCDQHHLVVQADQSGEYTAWWHDRNLRYRVDQVEVPVLMVQGLQDWNVKPDHIAHYFNDLTAPKTLIAPQMGHSYPTLGDRDKDEPDGPFGWWWEFATAFFDETLRGERTGLFEKDLAYVQDSTKEWHIYEGDWPPVDATWQPLALTPGKMTLDGESSGTVSWNADPTSSIYLQDGQQVVFETDAFEETLHTSGTPHLNLTLTSDAANVHLTAVLQYQAPGLDAWSRVNHGYLNPIYREGLSDPRPVLPGIPVEVTIQFYPQEDIFEVGGKLRLTLGSTDGTRTVQVFDPAHIQVDLGAEERPGQFWLPLSPLAVSDQ